MKIKEKRKRIEDIFNKQKEVISNITIENGIESMMRIKMLEVQKDMVIAIPTTIESR